MIFIFSIFSLYLKRILIRQQSELNLKERNETINLHNNTWQRDKNFCLSVYLFLRFHFYICPLMGKNSPLFLRLPLHIYLFLRHKLLCSSLCRFVEWGLATLLRYYVPKKCQELYKIKRCSLNTFIVTQKLPRSTL